MLGTVIVRMLLFLFLFATGFGELLSSKLTERTVLELMTVLLTGELALFAIMTPDEPLLPYFIPVLLIVLMHRLRAFSLKVFRYLVMRHQAAAEKSATHDRNKEQNAVAKGLFKTKMGLPLIENGKVCTEHLKKISQTPLWLRQELRKFGYRDIRQVNYLTIDESGNFYMDLKNHQKKV